MTSRATIYQFILLLSFFFLRCSSQEFIFNGFLHASNLSFDGSSKITQDGVLQLTNNTLLIMGQAFFAYPIPMIKNYNNISEVVSFSTTFVFDIITVGSGGGQGLTFVVAPSKSLPGAYPGPYLGLLGPSNNGNFSNHVFAVEFDTCLNKAFNETNGNHVGIDINNLKSNISKLAAYYSNESTEVDFSLNSGQQIQVWIDYNGTTKVIDVTVVPLSIPKPSRPLISYAFDLLPIFKREMYVGFTSSTGKLKRRCSSHYILGWSFRSKGPAQAIDLSNLPKFQRPTNEESISQENKTSKESGSKKTTIITGVASSFVTFTLIVILITVSFYLWQRAKPAEQVEEWELDHPHRLKYNDLYRATKGFEETELIGSGGFGHVYKGVLPHTKEVVAIKKISNNARQGVREFVAEISSLGRMRHRNLVGLRGWCKRNEDLIIVYEFMPNGSLDTHLFNNRGNTRAVLSWEQRFKILKGVASGLLYLHEEWEKVVVHRDIKSSNVLLSSDLTPKLGDFGLAKLYEHDTNPNTTHAAGTLGYMAPELLRMGKATTRSDVFAFGVLLLEVACGRRPNELGASENELGLVGWVRDCEVRGELMTVVDPRLGNEYNNQEMEMVLKLGLVCCQSVAESRPSMRQVILFLTGTEHLADDMELVSLDTNSVNLETQNSRLLSNGSISSSTLHVGR